VSCAVQRPATFLLVAGMLACSSIPRRPGGEDAGEGNSCPGYGPGGSGLGDSGSGSQAPDADLGDASTPPSCLAGGPGLSDCGPVKESYCTSLVARAPASYRMIGGLGAAAARVRLRHPGAAKAAVVPALRVILDEGEGWDQEAP
jgi:hypothetical protein